ncbi:MAG: hypothetical protein H7Y13_02700 [Sphingobacteriaceae bacterium]|nr:hypothetical protein [Sphingobacteriaceae bacterium]
MHKFPISKYKRYSELPLDELNTQKFAIYLIDFNWNYLFANAVACEVLNKTQDEVVGTSAFAGIEVDPEYSLFLKKVENGSVATINTISPATRKRVSVTGYPLEDCYYFAVSVLPDKEDLMNELRSQLKK